MAMKQDSNKEVERRAAVALTAIKQTKDDGKGNSAVSLFVSHHLEELDGAYWTKHAGSARPSPKKVLDLLELRSHWGGKDKLDAFDFTLPGAVTNYVISVRFDDDGDIGNISMEC